jgi:hypothetical protein
MSGLQEAKYHIAAQPFRLTSTHLCPLREQPLGAIVVSLFFSEI